MPERRWSNARLREAARTATSYRQILAQLGLRPAGGNYAHVTRVIRELGIPTDHFRSKAWNKGLRTPKAPRVQLSEILVKGSTYQSFKLKRRLFAAGLKEPRCELCGWAEKAPDGRIPLELDHINGRRDDNRLENLRILCPNCHSLQPTHRGLNQRRKAASS